MIAGSHELSVKLNKLSDIQTVLVPAVKKQAEVVRAAAVRLCPANHGELRGSIYTKADVEGQKVIGTVYTNKDYAPYVEFGTGPQGQADHEGISPNVAVTYTQNPWWFSGDAIDPADAERYHFIKAEYNGKVFYRTNGQAAQPFMYPALKSNEPKITDALRTDVAKRLAQIGGSG